jgi:phosphoglucomutase
VLAANGIEVMIDQAVGYSPTPVISYAILIYNRGKTSGFADGIVITPSHNPPEDGGIEYNPRMVGRLIPKGQNGSVWTIGKYGIIMDLLAAEMMAKNDRDLGELYRDLTKEFGEPVYERIDAAATPAQKTILSKLSPEQVQDPELAGDTIVAKLATAPGNGAAIGGLKVVTAQGWFAARRGSLPGRSNPSVIDSGLHIGILSIPG